MKTEFESFIEDEMKPKTIEYVRKYLKNTPVSDVPLFYFDVITSLGMTEMPNKNTKLAEIAIHNGDIQAAKRSLLTNMINKMHKND